MPNEMMMDPNSAARAGEMSGMPMDPNSAVREGELNPSNPGPQEDLALVTSVMKMLDPGSAVRESEASSGDMASMSSKLQELAQKIMQGFTLSPVVRKSLADKAVSLMDSQSATRGGELGPRETTGAAMPGREMGYTVDGQTQKMTRKQYQDMVNSGQITQDPNLMGPR